MLPHPESRFRPVFCLHVYRSDEQLRFGGLLSCRLFASGFERLLPETQRCERWRESGVGVQAISLGVPSCLVIRDLASDEEDPESVFRVFSIHTRIRGLFRLMNDV